VCFTIEKVVPTLKNTLAYYIPTYEARVVVLNSPNMGLGRVFNFATRDKM
jgi:hypothetical protein